VSAQLLFLLSLALLGSGIFLVLTRQNAIAALMGIELMLNAATVNLVAGNLRHPSGLDGQTIAVFVIVIAAAEAAVALAIVLQLFERRRSIQLNEAQQLKG
jgi:NADH:ubiquinone oxidoreductase subunit K